MANTPKPPGGISYLAEPLLTHPHFQGHLHQIHGASLGSMHGDIFSIFTDFSPIFYFSLTLLLPNKTQIIWHTV